MRRSKLTPRQAALFEVGRNRKVTTRMLAISASVNGLGEVRVSLARMDPTTRRMVPLEVDQPELDPSAPVVLARVLADTAQRVLLDTLLSDRYTA